MKMLKKAGAIAIAGAMALTLGTVSALAADEVSLKINGEITKAEDASGVITVTVPYEAVGVDQVTLLAEIGTEADKFAGSIEYKTTAYIDQESKDGSFEFKINKSRLTPSESTDIADNAEAVYINVKIGGTGIDTPDTDSILVYEKPQDTTPITSADVKGALEVKDGAAVVFPDTTKGIMRLDATDLIATTDDEGNTITPKLDLATQVVTIDGVEARYTVYNGVTKLVTLVDTSVSTHTIAITNKDGGTKQFKYGDATLDVDVSAGDLSVVVDMILAGTQMKNTTDSWAVLAADATGDYDVSAGDLSSVIDLILTPSTLPGAAK